MTASDEDFTHQIYLRLRNRHSGSDWAYVEEVRTGTGHSSRAGFIDAFAMGLWQKNKGCIAYEVKVSRADFMKDVQNFNEKQADALRNSNQFYYVCPHKLIDKSEVPEIAGLMYADSGDLLKTVKVAPLREMPGNALEAEFVGSLLRTMGGKSKFEPYVKYCGKEITTKDLDELAKKHKDALYESEVKAAATNRAAKMRLGAWHAVSALRDVLNVSLWDVDFHDRAWVERLVARVKEVERGNRASDNIRSNFDCLKRSVEALGHIMDEEKKNGEKK